MSTNSGGSFWKAWRLCTKGASKPLWMALLMCAVMTAQMVLTVRLRPGALPSKAFLVDAVLLVFCLAMGTWQIEGELGERLAFLGIVPQPVDTRRLLLVPMCTLGFVMTAALAIGQRLPPAVALTLLGVAWSTTAATRWFWKLRFWPLLVLPVLATAPAAAYAAHHVVGWGAAAVVSMTLAIGALAFQPRPYVGERLSRLLNGGRTPARDLVARRAVPGAISAAVSDRGRRSMLFTEFGLGRILTIIMTVAGVVLGMLFPVLGPRQEILFCPILAGMALAGAHAGDMYEFLRPLPYSRRRHFVRSVAPALLIVLLVPATALCFVNLDWFNHGGLLGLFSRRHGAPTAQDIGYLRHVLGATFLPEAWPEGGLSGDLWARLRPLLYLDILRTFILMIAVLFAVPIRKVGERYGHQKVQVMSLVILLAAFSAMLCNGFASLSRRVPVPPLWCLALLACVSIAHFVWKARARARRV